MTAELLPADFTNWPCGGWCLGECPGCCACGTSGCFGCELDDTATSASSDAP